MDIFWRYSVAELDYLSFEVLAVLEVLVWVQEMFFLVHCMKTFIIIVSTMNPIDRKKVHLKYKQSKTKILLPTFMMEIKLNMIS